VGSADVATTADSSDPEATAEYIARWDPAHILAECHAKRVIIGLHDHDHDCFKFGLNGSVDEDYAFGEEEFCWTLIALAVTYADRDGYDESWKVAVLNSYVDELPEWLRDQP
jgi:hypothetical protein